MGNLACYAHTFVRKMVVYIDVSHAHALTWLPLQGLLEHMAKFKSGYVLYYCLLFLNPLHPIAAKCTRVISCPLHPTAAKCTCVQLTAEGDTLPSVRSYTKCQLLQK